MGGSVAVAADDGRPRKSKALLRPNHVDDTLLGGRRADIRNPEFGDIRLKGGELAGTPSTVVDLRDYEQRGGWAILREGAVPSDAVTRAVEESS